MAVFVGVVLLSPGQLRSEVDAARVEPVLPAPARAETSAAESRAGFGVQSADPAEPEPVAQQNTDPADPEPAAP